MTRPDDRPAAPDKLNESETERRARRGRTGGDTEGRPLEAEETAPGERGDAPYGDSEPKGKRDPGTPPGT